MSSEEYAPTIDLSAYAMVIIYTGMKLVTQPISTATLLLHNNATLAIDLTRSERSYVVGTVSDGVWSDDSLTFSDYRSAKMEWLLRVEYD